MITFVYLYYLFSITGIRDICFRIQIRMTYKYVNRNPLEIQNIGYRKRCFPCTVWINDPSRAMLTVTSSPC